MMFCGTDVDIGDTVSVNYKKISQTGSVLNCYSTGEIKGIYPSYVYGSVTLRIKSDSGVNLEILEKYTVTLENHSALLINIGGSYG